MLKNPPTAPGWPLIGNLPARIRNPLGFYLDLSMKHGPVVATKIGPWRVYSVSDPEGIKRVLLDNASNYVKGDIWEKFKPLLGNGLLSSDGEFWKRQRKLAQPAFHRKNIEGMVDQIRGSASRVLGDWGRFEDGREFNIHEQMRKLTIAVSTSCFLGLDLSAEADDVGHALDLIHAEGLRRVFNLIPFRERMPLPGQRKALAALSFLDELVNRIIEKRRKSTELHQDFLSLMMRSKDEGSGEVMTSTQLRDEVMTLFLAGYDTSANVLGWTWYLLLSNPEALERVRAEIDAVVGDAEPRTEHLMSLSYLHRTLQEAMRLYPPVCTFSRSVVQDDEILGFRVRAGSVIAINPYMMHHHPKFWPDPERFDPDRFLESESAGRHKYLYIPFGAGPRGCIGRDFAMIELTMAIVMVLQRYSLSLVPNQVVHKKATITLCPDPGVQVTLRARSLKEVAS
jgi:cytochrome P450